MNPEAQIEQLKSEQAGLWEEVYALRLLPDTYENRQALHNLYQQIGELEQQIELIELDIVTDDGESAAEYNRDVILAQQELEYFEGLSYRDDEVSDYGCDFGDLGE